MKTVCVLLCTYNGELYIKEQLDSLLQQDYPFDLIIQDDGSKDCTLEIVNKYIQDHESISIRQIRNSHMNFGYPRCFLELLKVSGDYDFYFWCDQDDIWHKNKIRFMVSSLEQIEEKIPMMAYHRFNLCNDNLIKQGEGAKLPSDYNSTLENSIFDLKEAFGFCVCFNVLMKKLILKDEDIIIKHGRKDWWILLLGCTYGKVIYRQDILAEYRRHMDAVTYLNTQIGINKIFINIKKILMFKKDLLKIYSDLDDFINLHKAPMTKNQLIMLKLFSKKGNRLKKIFYRGRLRLNIFDELAFRVCFLLYG